MKTDEQKKTKPNRHTNIFELENHSNYRGEARMNGLTFQRN